MARATAQMGAGQRGGAERLVQLGSGPRYRDIYDPDHHFRTAYPKAKVFAKSCFCCEKDVGTKPRT